MGDKKLTLRKATKQDVKTLYDWANDIDVRLNAFNQKNIEWKQHLLWFDKKINSKESEIFILENKNIAIGQIRIDKKKDHWIIDYSVGNEFRGKGFGKKMVQKLIKSRNIDLLAEVKNSNIASQKVFESLNFQKYMCEDKIVYTLSNS